ncbi:MAG: ATP-binding protein [Odoribacter sp.]
MNSKNYIYQLIEAGEHQQQDFKFEISDARKIAKTLSAFSNTDGGRLLVGVKDNGKIAGIRSEEEIYMIEAAAKLYCHPQIDCQMNVHQVEGRTVLEVIVSPGKQKPYYAKDTNNKGWAYIRIKDENILATPVHLKIWQQERTPKGSFIHYSEQEQLLMDYLDSHTQITLNQYCRLARLPRPKAESTLAKFIRFELIELVFENHRFYFRQK